MLIAREGWVEKLVEILKMTAMKVVLSQTVKQRQPSRSVVKVKSNRTKALMNSIRRINAKIMVSKITRVSLKMNNWKTVLET